MNVKNRLFIMVLFFCIQGFCQVAIGKSGISSPSVSLEFGSGNRGMILPWVTTAASISSAVNGTLVYDLNDKKVKVKYNTLWKDLSVDLFGTTIDPVSGIDGVLIQNAETENINARSAVGNSLSSVPGILVLEATDKVMVLPKVASPHLNIINPSPGMMAYDTDNKQLAVFNGKMWTFWKP